MRPNCDALAKRLPTISVIGVIGEANVFKVLAQRDHAVIEAHTRYAASELVDLKAARPLVAAIEAFAVTLRRKEYVIFDSGIDGFGKVGIEANCRRSAGQPTGAEVLRTNSVATVWRRERPCGRLRELWRTY